MNNNEDGDRKESRANDSALNPMVVEESLRSVFRELMKNPIIIIVTPSNGNGPHKTHPKNRQPSSVTGVEPKEKKARHDTTKSHNVVPSPSHALLMALQRQNLLKTGLTRALPVQLQPRFSPSNVAGLRPCQGRGSQETAHTRPIPRVGNLQLRPPTLGPFQWMLFQISQQNADTQMGQPGHHFGQPAGRPCQVLQIQTSEQSAHAHTGHQNPRADNHQLRPTALRPGQGLQFQTFQQSVAAHWRPENDTTAARSGSQRPFTNGDNQLGYVDSVSAQGQKALPSVEQQSDGELSQVIDLLWEDKEKSTPSVNTAVEIVVSEELPEANIDRDIEITESEELQAEDSDEENSNTSQDGNTP